MTEPTLGRAEGFPVRQPWRGSLCLAQQASLLGLGLLLVLGSWLLARRWTGAFEQPLDSSVLIATASLLSVWSGGVRWGWCAWRKIGPDRSVWAHHVFGTLTTAGLLEFGVALSLPGSSPGALGVFWCVLLATETAWGFVYHACPAAEIPPRRAIRDTELESDVIGSAWRVRMAASSSAFPPLEIGVDGDSEELLAADESQRISRVRDPHGSEIISGLVRCSFAPGERQRDIHLAFCPPLKHLPHFSMEQVEGPPARTRALLVESFGVGLEIKLTSLSSEPASVQIQFFACEEATADEPD